MVWTPLHGVRPLNLAAGWLAESTLLSSVEFYDTSSSFGSHMVPSLTPSFECAVSSTGDHCSVWLFSLALSYVTSITAGFGIIVNGFLLCLNGMVLTSLGFSDGDSDDSFLTDSCQLA